MHNAASRHTGRRLYDEDADAYGVASRRTAPVTRDVCVVHDRSDGDDDDGEGAGHGGSNHVKRSPAPLLTRQTPPSPLSAAETREQRCAVSSAREEGNTHDGSSGGSGSGSVACLGLSCSEEGALTRCTARAMVLAKTPRTDSRAHSSCLPSTNNTTVVTAAVAAGNDEDRRDKADDVGDADCTMHNDDDTAMARRAAQVHRVTASSLSPRARSPHSSAHTTQTSQPAVDTTTTTTTMRAITAAPPPPLAPASSPRPRSRSRTAHADVCAALLRTERALAEARDTATQRGCALDSATAALQRERASVQQLREAHASELASVRDAHATQVQQLRDQLHVLTTMVERTAADKDTLAADATRRRDELLSLLQRERTEKRAILADYRAETEALIVEQAKELTRLRGALDAATASAEQLRGDVDALTNARAILQARVEELQGQLTRAQAEQRQAATQSAARVDELTAQLHESAQALHAQREAHATALASVRREAAQELVATRAAHDAALKSLAQQHEAQLTQARAHSTSVQREQQRAADVERACAAQLREQERVAGEQQRQHEAVLQQEREAHAAALAQTEARLADAQAQLRACSEELQLCRQQLHEAVAAAQQERERARAEAAHEVARSSKAADARHAEELQRLHNELTALRVSGDGLRDELARVRAAARAKDEVVRQLREEAAQLRRDTAQREGALQGQLEEQLDAQAAEMRRMDELMHSLRSDLVKAQAMTAQYQQELAAAYRDAEGTRAELELALEHAHAARVKLQEEADYREQVVQELQSTVHLLTSRIDAAEDDARRAHDEVDVLNRKLQDTHTLMGRQEAMVGQLNAKLRAYEARGGVL